MGRGGEGKATSTRLVWGWRGGEERGRRWWRSREEAEGTSLVPPSAAIPVTSVSLYLMEF